MDSPVIDSFYHGKYLILLRCFDILVDIQFRYIYHEIMSELRQVSEKKVRVLIAKVGLDGHDRGAKVVSRALRDAGFEVIYTGLRRTPDEIVNTAIQEDVDIIGISILSGAHNILIKKTIQLLRKNFASDIKVIVGGIIPEKDISTLKKEGVAAIFTPGSLTSEIIEWIKCQQRTKKN